VKIFLGGETDSADSVERERRLMPDVTLCHITSMKERKNQQANEGDTPRLVLATSASRFGPVEN